VEDQIERICRLFGYDAALRQCSLHDPCVGTEDLQRRLVPELLDGPSEPADIREDMRARHLRHPRIVVRRASAARWPDSVGQD